MIVQVSICGLGNTGAEIAFALLQERKVIFHINCMDPSEDISGNYIDLSHALALSHHKISLNDKVRFKNSEIIFHTAGANIPKGGDRNDVLKLSAAITNTLFEGIHFATQALVVVVANPVEPICNIILKHQKDRVQICGTGTLLDQFRLNSYISKNSHCNPQDVKSLVLGEHGSDMVPIWSQSYIHKKKFHEILSTALLEKCIEETKNAAHSIKTYNGHTKYGVSYCALYLMYAWLNEETTTTVCSTPQDNYYQHISNTKGCISIPVKIGARKIVAFPVKMNQIEEQHFRDAANKINNLTRKCI